MQLLEILRRRRTNGMFTYELDMAYPTGRRKTREIFLDAPGFSELTWNYETEQFLTYQACEMGSVGNSDLDRIERWIEDVFDECAHESDIYVDDMMKRLFIEVAAKENKFRARFVGNFRMYRRFTYVNGIGRQKATDDETISDIYVTFPPIPPYPFEESGGIEDLPF